MLLPCFHCLPRLYLGYSRGNLQYGSPSCLPSKEISLQICVLRDTATFGCTLMPQAARRFQRRRGYNCKDLRSTSGSNCRSWCPCFALAHSFFQSSFALARAHLVTVGT